MHINTAEFVAPGGQELRGAAAGGVPVGQLAQKCLERGRRIGSLALGAPAKDLVDGREVLRPGGHSSEHAISSISAEQPLRAGSVQ